MTNHTIFLLTLTYVLLVQDGVLWGYNNFRSILRIHQINNKEWEGNSLTLSKRSGGGMKMISTQSWKIVCTKNEKGTVFCSTAQEDHQDHLCRRLQKRQSMSLAKCWKYFEFRDCISDERRKWETRWTRGGLIEYICRNINILLHIIFPILLQRMLTASCLFPRVCVCVCVS